jgi:hypothetical protein
MTKFKGSCACGNVIFQCDSEVLGFSACHCTICQQVSGGPYLAFIDFNTADITWTKEPDMWRAGELAERGFCMNCGSVVSMRYLMQTHRISVTCGMIEDKSKLPKIQQHIFLKEKAPYFVLADDGAERHDEFPGDFGERLQKWRQSQKQA